MILGNEHIKYVCQEAIDLVHKYHADPEIVHLGALLHNIALIRQLGERKDHHRSSKNATTIEELCVPDADILTHFDNISMLFNTVYHRCNIQLYEVREAFEKDYHDPSERTKESFRAKYQQIGEIVLGMNGSESNGPSTKRDPD